MDCPLKLMIVAAAVAAAPIPVLAQTWPAGVVAAGPRMAAAQGQPLVVVVRDARILRRPGGIPPTQPTDRLPLRLSSVESDEVPLVELRPKDEWTEDEGFSVSATRVAFKRRF